MILDLIIIHLEFAFTLHCLFAGITSLDRALRLSVDYGTNASRIPLCVCTF